MVPMPPGLGVEIVMVSWPNFLVSRGLCQTCSVVCVDARMCMLVRANTAVVLETPSEPILMGYT